MIRVRYKNTGIRGIAFDHKSAGAKPTWTPPIPVWGSAPLPLDNFGGAVVDPSETISNPNRIYASASAVSSSVAAPEYTPSFANPPWFHALTSGVATVWNDLFASTINPNPQPKSMDPLPASERATQRGDAYILLAFAGVAFIAIKLGKW